MELREQPLQLELFVVWQVIPLKRKFVVKGASLSHFSVQLVMEGVANLLQIAYR